MQLAISISLDDPLTLPINYNHIIQAIIYNSTEDSEHSTFLHDVGFKYEKRAYKLFTFGRLMGKCKVVDKKITFFDKVSLEVRGMDPLMIRTLQKSITDKGIRFGDRIINDIETECLDRRVESNAILVKMNSPLTVYSTTPGMKERHYYSPDESDFSSAISGNFYRKYKACYGVEVDSEIQIIPYKVEDSDRVVTNYKGTYITAYRGQYIIAGKRKYLDFLYQTGLGSKNSQGFGMFDIIDEDKGEAYADVCNTHK